MGKHTKIIEHTKEWLTITEVMDRLKISRTTVYRLTREGSLPSYKMGVNVRYKLEDVEKALIPAKTG